jgi:hypothetical protein
MSPTFLEKQSTRREMLRDSAVFAGRALLASLFPASFLRAGLTGMRQQHLKLSISLHRMALNF